MRFSRPASLLPSDTGEPRWKPLHWVIEAPDVIVDHGGFDAIIGNPPFLGGQKVQVQTSRAQTFETGLSIG